MNYAKPVKYNDNPVLSNRTVRKVGHNFLMSMGVPFTFTMIAIILAYAAGNTLFISPSGSMGTLKNVMTFVRAIVLTIVAALALNSNLNSGRMDFSLGATGILASLITSYIIPQITTASEIFAFLGLTMLFGAALGLIHAIIFIVLKLPPIVTSLGMCLVFEGMCKILVGDDLSVQLKSSQVTANFFLEPIVILPILVLVVTIMSLIICYSKFGYDKNALVYDQKVSVETGVREVRNCVICFIMAGALIGLYQVIDITGTSAISIKVDLGSSGAIFKNFLPIFIGGIIAKYSNQIVGLLLAVFSTTMLNFGMEKATSIGFEADLRALITGFMVFGVLVYMVDKNRFVNWVKMRKYVAKEHYLNPKIKKEEE